MLYMAVAHQPPRSFLALLLLSPLMFMVCSAAYQTKPIDPGLVVMTLPQPVFGPKSLVFDGHGQGPYSGVSDGRILRWHGVRHGWVEFAYNYRHKRVAICAPKKKLVVPEAVCGRPLGLQFHRESGDLYVADAYLGLLRVPARGGLAEVVATAAGGTPFNFLDGLDVDQTTGDVYFTESSTMYRRSEYLLVVAMGDETGRLLRYNRRHGHQVEVLHSDLPFPNGLAVGADGTHVMVVLTALCELRRYWVRGPRAGKWETFAELPGYPENVRPDGRGGYWVGLSRGVSVAGGDNGAARIMAVRVSGDDGRIVEALDGFSFASVSEVTERNGTLWLGSIDTPYAGTFKRHAS